MVDRDVVLAKADRIEQCLRRIGEARAEESLESWIVEDLQALNLQRAVQAAIDLAAHVVATEGYGLPDKLAATFDLLERERVIEPALAERMRKMVGFRNVAVHAYERLDPVIVEAIIENDLDDLRRFVRVVLTRFGLAADD